MSVRRLPWLAFAFAVCLLSSAPAQDRPPPMPPAGDVQELARGPIHEAFGQPTTFNPEAGPIAPKAPPEAVEELPPDQKPEGDNVAWIPGYWSWDDEDKRFIWVSGFWRAVPPNRTWVPGYWTPVADGSQWVSGYWGQDRATEVEYLPPPPESLEDGPSTEATVAGQVWTPGCWVWRDTRYWWRPGFWAAANPNWVWVPARYVWTPGGYVFVDGFWDFPLAGRGLLFAPVVFARAPAGFVFTPGVVLDTRFLTASLFVRPTYHAYYFGDFYAPTYAKAGIFPWFAFHASRYGHDPLYDHVRVVHARTDPNWERNLRAAYLERRETEAARPPHLFREYSDWARRRAGEERQVAAFARPLPEVQRSRDFPVRLEAVPERQAAAVRQEARKVREYQERRVEREREAARGAAPAKRTEPTRVKLPDPPKLNPGAPARTAPAVRPPESPRVPDPTPPTAPRTKPRGLPHPDDNIRGDPDGGAPPKGRVADPVPKPKTDTPPRKDPPVVTPPKKDPPVVTPPKKDPPVVSPPPKKDPPKAPPPKGPPKKDKD